MLTRFTSRAFRRCIRHPFWADFMANGPPRGTGLALTAAFLTASIGYGLAVGGKWDALTAEYGTPTDIAANAVGFRIDTVQIAGQHELTDASIFAAAGVSQTHSLLFLDTEKAREGLEGLPLVKSAQVRKLFPDTLAVTLVERTPFALWQRDGGVSVIARDGVKLDDSVPGRFASLPLVVGEGAEKHVGEIVDMLTAYPKLQARVKAATLVAQRRWNLTLDNGVTVRLPEHGVAEAMATLDNLQDDDKVLDKAILSIDMRLPNRIAFRLTSEAAAARAADIAKMLKKKGAPA